LTVPSTGRRYTLQPGERLRFTSIAGSLTGLRLAEDGLHAAFRGRVSGLARVTSGLEAESLMPSMLDLWITGRLQTVTLGAAGALAAAVLALAVTEIRPRSLRARP
jgi:hypothetical protein